MTADDRRRSPPSTLARPSVIADPPSGPIVVAPRQLDRGDPPPAGAPAQPRAAGVRDAAADHVRGAVRLRVRRIDHGARLQQLQAVRDPGDLRPDRAVRLDLHRPRHRRGPHQGLHRPAAVAADVPVGGAARAHHERRRAQRALVRGDARRRVHHRVPRSRARSSARSAPRCCCSCSPTRSAGSRRTPGWSVGSAEAVNSIAFLWMFVAHVHLVGLRRRPRTCRAGCSRSPSTTRSPSSPTPAAPSTTAATRATTSGWPSRGRSASPSCSAVWRSASSPRRRR